MAIQLSKQKYFNEIVNFYVIKFEQINSFRKIAGFLFYKFNRFSLD